MGAFAENTTWIGNVFLKLPDQQLAETLASDNATGMLGTIFVPINRAVESWLAQFQQEAPLPTVGPLANAAKQTRWLARTGLKAPLMSHSASSHPQAKALEMGLGAACCLQFALLRETGPHMSWASSPLQAS
jgi:hypothetical protein